MNTHESPKDLLEAGARIEALRRKVSELIIESKRYKAQRNEARGRVAELEAHPIRYTVRRLLRLNV